MKRRFLLLLVVSLIVQFLVLLEVFLLPTDSIVTLPSSLSSIFTKNKTLTKEEVFKYLLSISFPLYDSEGRESCTGFTVAANPKSYMALYSTAGHCFSANRMRIGQTHWHTSPVLFVVQRYQADLFIGVKPFCSSVEKSALLPVHGVTFERGAMYYTLGQNGSRDERGVFVRKLLHLKYERNNKERGLVFSLITSPKEPLPNVACNGIGCGFRVKGAVSGTPIMNAHGEVVAIVRGFSAKEAAYEIYATNIEDLQKELAPFLKNEMKVDEFHPSVCEGALPAFPERVVVPEAKEKVGPPEAFFIPSQEFLQEMNEVGFCARTKDYLHALQPSGEKFYGNGDDQGINERYAAFTATPVISHYLNPSTKRWRLLLSRNNITCVVAIGSDWEKIVPSEKKSGFFWNHPYVKRIGQCDSLSAHEEKLFTAYKEDVIGRGRNDPYPGVFDIKESYTYFLLNDGGTWTIISHITYENPPERICIDAYGRNWMYNDYSDRYFQ